MNSAPASRSSSSRSQLAEKTFWDDTFADDRPLAGLTRQQTCADLRPPINSERTGGSENTNESAMFTAMQRIGAGRTAKANGRVEALLASPTPARQYDLRVFASCAVRQPASYTILAATDIELTQ